jgi:VWFA-related protein
MCEPGTWTLRVACAVVLFLSGFTLIPFALAQQYLGTGGIALASPVVTSLDEPNFSITKQVDEVNLVFTVTDSRRRLLRNLSSADFQLLDNHRPPDKIRYFQQQSSLPLQIALLIDASSSITGRFGFEKKAASIFLKEIVRPGVDQAFLVAFNSEIHLLRDFTDDVAALQESLSILKPGGNTALYDAIVFAADKLRSHPDASVTRRVIVLISDGEDTKHHAILYDAEQAAMQADSILFVLSTNTIRHNSEHPHGEAVLDILSRATGGNILPARENSEINSAFRSIEKSLRSQYVLGYTPAEFKADGSFHTIEIVPRKSRLKVQCRRGYYAIHR